MHTKHAILASGIVPYLQESIVEIKKGDVTIDDLEQWEKLAGPTKKEQWKEGRSAKECAKRWLKGKNNPPSEVSSLLAVGAATR